MSVVRWCRLAALLLLVGIVLPPLSATAAVVAPLPAFVVAVRPAATTRTGGRVPVRRWIEAGRTTAYDEALVGYDPAINLPVAGAPRAVVGEAHAYDDRLKHADGRELRGEGTLYDHPAAVPAAEGTTTLYRAVSQAELADIGATGGFRAGEGSMGNKWFAESAEDAAAWGKQFFQQDGQPFFTVRVQVPTSVADQMFRMPMLDSIGPARSAEGAVLDLVNSGGSIDALGANAVP